MNVKAAVIQAASILFDRQATVDKAVKLIHEAAESGTQIILFPEAFIPAYPRGLTFGTVVGSRTEKGRELYRRYWDASVDLAAGHLAPICEAAAAAQAYVNIGIIERGSSSRGSTLYCTLVYIGPDGKILGKHRKLKPTAAERFIWGEGDGSTLAPISTPYGAMGGLICWENYMPQARMALYSKGVEIYLAPTADARESWQATLRHIALEGRCYVLGCNQYVTRNMVPDDIAELGDLPRGDAIMSRGGSAIISPLGEVMAGPLYDKEGILYADLNMDAITEARFDFDVVGHYARPDVFRLSINEEPQLPVDNDEFSEAD